MSAAAAAAQCLPCTANGSKRRVPRRPRTANPAMAPAFVESPKPVTTNHTPAVNIDKTETASKARPSRRPCAVCRHHVDPIDRRELVRVIPSSVPAPRHSASRDPGHSEPGDQTSVSTSSSSSGATRTARAFDPSDGPTIPLRSRMSMTLPARANPIRSFRCSIEVDPS